MRQLFWLTILLLLTNTANASNTTQLGLLQVYQLAVQNSPELAAAHAQYQARAENIPLARARLLPQLSLGAKYQDSNSSATTTIGQKNSQNRHNHSLQASLNQPLFRLDSWYQLKAAKSDNEQALLELSASEQNLILQSAQAYFAVLRAEDELAATNAEERALAKQFELAKGRFEVGISDNIDVLQAKAAHDSAIASQLLAQSRAADAKQALTSLIDAQVHSLQGLQHQLPIALPQPNKVKPWVAKANDNNLQLQASRLAIASAEHSLQQRKAGHAPTLDAIAQYQRADSTSLGFIEPPAGPSYKRHANQSVLGLQLNIPLYSGGATSASVRQGRQQKNQVQFNYEALRRQVEEDVHNLLRALNTDVSQIQARQQSVKSSQSALLATEKGYQLGIRTINDVLDAQRQLYAAVRNYNNARYDYLLNNLRLQLVAGSLSAQHLEDISLYLSPEYDSQRDFLPPLN